MDIWPPREIKELFPRIKGALKRCKSELVNERGLIEKMMCIDV